MSLPELATSFLDLWHHFDGVEARRFDREGPPPALTPFDEETVAQHAAAFRSLAGAVEDLDLDRVVDEIDRTLLLDAVRVRLRRLEKERPERWNPVLWTDRLRQTLDQRPGDAAIVAGVPDWVERARITIARPPVFHVGLALEDLGAARAALRSQFGVVEGDALGAAEQALESLDRFLRHEVEPDADPKAGALGADETSWRLHHDGKLDMSPNEAERRMVRRLADLAGLIETPRPIRPPGGPVPDAVALAGRHPSLVRRRLLAPEWTNGWVQFALDRLNEGGVAAAGEAYLAAKIGALDLAIQTGRIPAGQGIADAAERLPGRAAALRMLVVRPLEAFAAAALAAQWADLFATMSLGAAEFSRRVGEAGLLHPALAQWSFGAADA